MKDTRPYVDATSRFLEREGLRVHYKREGAGAPLLLLHGSGSSLHSFDEISRRLAGTCEVVRLDLPGFGLTGPRPDRDYRIGTYVSFLAGFMQALSFDSFHLAGHSLGGNIAWNFALDHPHRVRSLVLMNATGYPGKSLPPAMRLARNPFIRPILRRWGGRGATSRSLRNAVGPRALPRVERIADRVHALMSLPGNRSAFVDLANTDQADRSREIGRITAPTLILRGEAIDGQHFLHDIPGSREIVYEGVGHLLPEEVPVEAASAILEFLAIAGGGSGAKDAPS